MLILCLSKINSQNSILNLPKIINLPSFITILQILIFQYYSNINRVYF